jgi:hypothetical protein
VGGSSSNRDTFAKLFEISSSEGLVSVFVFWFSFCMCLSPSGQPLKQFEKGLGGEFRGVYFFLKRQLPSRRRGCGFNFLNSLREIVVPAEFLLDDDLQSFIRIEDGLLRSLGSAGGGPGYQRA